MSRSIYVNLPAKDVAAARDFYTKMGFGINEQFSSDQQAVVVIDDGIALMLVTEDFFKQSVKREVADTQSVREVGLAIQVANRAEVDRLVNAAVAAGGKAEGDTVEDAEIGMYSRGASDLDGHNFFILCMGA